MDAWRKSERAEYAAAPKQKQAIYRSAAFAPTAASSERSMPHGNYTIIAAQCSTAGDVIWQRQSAPIWV
jgi:hypothetical protein